MTGERLAEMKADLDFLRDERSRDHTKDLTELIKEVEKLWGEVYRMKEDVELLDCLNAAGVDNWEGHGEAYRMMAERARGETE